MCGALQDNAYDLAAEQKTRALSHCGFNFPMAKETTHSTPVFKDIT
jgi:hypothetical protein